MPDTVGRGGTATGFGGGVAMFIGLVTAFGANGRFPSLLQLHRKKSRGAKAALLRRIVQNQHSTCQLPENEREFKAGP
jgi:hypothetical protein